MATRSSAACNIRSAIVFALLLVLAFIILDSYTWRLLSMPWSIVSSSRMIGSFTNLGSSEQHPRLVSPEEAAAEIAKANQQWNGSSENTIASTSTEVPTPSSIEVAGSTPVGVPVSTHLEADASPPLQEPLQKVQSPEVPSPPPVQKVPSSLPGEQIAEKRNGPRTSLQKLEASLSHARFAIRRAVLTGKPERVIEGLVPEVYRNATIFQQSYYEMEKRLKVYAYSEGEEPLVHNGPCKEIYAIEGRFIQELQGKNGYLTTDPEQAHVFFLPFSVAMMVAYLYTPGSHDMSPLARFTRDYVNLVMHQYPFWNRSRGADHFMVSCHDWGPHISRAHPDLKTKSIRVLCNANASEGYVPNKDASLPEIHLVGGEVPKAFGGPPAAERNYLAFFAGGDHGPVRPVLFKYWKEKDDQVRVFERLASREEYQQYMQHSKYCLCPGGYEVNSPRIVEAIYNDCVPVIIADDFVLPFSDVLAWEAFSVKVLERDIPNLKHILQEIPNERYLEMQGRIKAVRKHFQFNQPPQRYDVFNMVLHSVWLRRLNMIVRD